jgi:hypothetical protein
MLALHFQIGTGAGGYKNFRQPDFFDEIQVALYRSKKKMAGLLTPASKSIKRMNFYFRKALFFSATMLRHLLHL